LGSDRKADSSYQTAEIKEQLQWRAKQRVEWREQRAEWREQGAEGREQR
jgi:hypothetical protein